MLRPQLSERVSSLTSRSLSVNFTLVLRMLLSIRKTYFNDSSKQRVSQYPLRLAFFTGKLYLLQNTPSGACETVTCGSNEVCVQLPNTTKCMETRKCISRALLR